jgi:hypothetical protein
MCEKCVTDATCDECGAGPGEKCMPHCLAPYGPGGPHEHDDEMSVEPLPEHLAPTDAARAALPGHTLPRPGNPVAMHGAHVIWLAHLGAGSPASRDNTLLWGVPISGDGDDEHALWDDLSITPLDPDFLGIDQEDAVALAAAWHALIEHANTLAAA